MWRILRPSWAVLVQPAIAPLLRLFVVGLAPAPQRDLLAWNGPTGMSAN